VHSSPNPAVGAVIVKDDVIVGEGYTPAARSAHAEIVALQQAETRPGGPRCMFTLSRAAMKADPPDESHHSCGHRRCTYLQNDA